MELNERISELEKEIIALKSKVNDLSKNTEEGAKPPVSIVGGGRDRSNIQSIDIKTGLGQIKGNAVIWNDSESKVPPINTSPTLPKEGFNKHSHSRYSGGALIKDVLEIVEYVWGTITNKHSQQFWQKEPEIAKDENSVPKIGKLSLIFDGITKRWGSTAYEIDIKKCYLVEYSGIDDEGNPIIKKDSKGNNMKSLLFNEDKTKSSIVWDENGQCYRFYAVYAPGEEGGGGGGGGGGGIG
jgi:hypothetical protein